MRSFLRAGGYHGAWQIAVVGSPVTDQEDHEQQGNFKDVAQIGKAQARWFNTSKGCGFIQYQTGRIVFLHFSAIMIDGYKLLNEGQAVEFEVKKGPKGLQAENVSAL
ncbi:MAG TPA: cold shock domain-containing protein [Candidatus Acidoferrum sp.]|nr:cold shock domain-containing protein [Candidatus Acidoferrum sp.]